MKSIGERASVACIGDVERRVEDHERAKEVDGWGPGAQDWFVHGREGLDQF